ncbi:MAG: DUF917 family protein, partial [Roseibium sp.]|uniref:S-methyl thiohydantoin desulfurase domain-containing protein n=1 Tax=Roseibium sp. TaxID=1936156 RepID=UPI002631A485
MSIQNLTREDGVAIVYGGAVLGGGGGGVISEGLEIARTATTLGKIELRSLNAFEDDALFATISGVGAPAAAQRYYLPVDETRATTLLNNKLSGRLAGLIPCENGPTASLSGWISSAMLGIPVVDAPADGRAHPTGLMGAMGAHNIAAYKSIQAVSGGDPEKVRYVSLIVEGSLETNAKIVRNTSVLAGGMVKVARDPLPVDYLRKNAAVGGITQALDIGRCILENEGSNAETIIDAIADRTGGRIVATGDIAVLDL